MPEPASNPFSLILLMEKIEQEIFILLGRIEVLNKRCDYERGADDLASFARAALDLARLRAAMLPRIGYFKARDPGQMPNVYINQPREEGEEDDR